MAQIDLSAFNLTAAEKLQLVEDLWDDLAATPAAIPEHDWQIEELERRAENLRNHPQSGQTWDAVLRRVRARFNRA